MIKKPKILIIRFSSIGDIVLTTPVIRCVKQQLDAEVHFCTKKNYNFLLSENPYVDKIHLLEDSLPTLVKALKEEKYDYVIDLHNNTRTRLIKLQLNAKSFTFDKLNFKKWLLVNLKINKLPRTHIVERYLETTKTLGVENDFEGLNYFIPHKDLVERDWLPEQFQGNFVAFAIGGQHATKQLPVKKIIDLCHRINRPIVLLGGKEDVALANEVEAFFKHSATDEAYLTNQFNLKTIIFNGCGKFNLNQSASIVQQASYVFTHDTGMMHIAAAFKKYTFSIWGNTVPEFGMYPYDTTFTIFEVPDLNCRPCSKIGFDKCPKGHFKCMNNQKFDFFLPE